MADSLFLLGGDGSVRTMSATAFVTEDEFQALLESHPQLLTDASFGEGEPRRWLLVRREAPVADKDDGGGRWSLDHLFLDQDGVPTLVEVKRATDTRARREVVAQMLDYAANAQGRWRASDLEAWLADACRVQGRDPEQLLSEHIASQDTGEFWKRVDANLGSGRIRMLFVADEIAPELQRIVEFLNEQMSPAVVAALELRPFASGADRLLAPKLLGFTAKAQATKGAPDGGFSEYWAAFDQAAGLHGVQRSTKLPRGPNYYSNLGAGTKGVSVVSFLAASRQRVGVYVGVWRPDALLIADAIMADGATIAEELGARLSMSQRGPETVWLQVAEAPANVGDRAAWPVQHRFLAETMAKARRVLEPRFAALQAIEPK